MKIETESRDDHQIKVMVEATKDEFESAKQLAMKKLSKKVKVPGFRPGKAPTAIVMRHLSPESILEEAIETFVDTNYSKVLDEAKIEPYGPGTLEKINQFEPPTFEFTVPLKPKVTLGDYQAIRIPYEYQAIGESEIEETLKNLAEQHAVLEPVERPAKKGDVVYINIQGRKPASDGKEEETITSQDQVPILIEPNPEGIKQEWPYPGFSKELIGTRINDQRTLEFQYPDDYDLENLRGTKVIFEVTVKDTKARVIPEINDDFAS